LNNRAVTGQSVERWEQRIISSAALSLLETKVAGKPCVHFTERWRSCQSKYGCFGLQPKITDAIIDEAECGWADFLLRRNETIEFPVQECTYMCADCQSLGHFLFPSDVSDRSESDEPSTVSIPFSRQRVERFLTAMKGQSNRDVSDTD
jgi:hypothetical protein